MKDISQGVMFLSDNRSQWETQDFRDLIEEMQPHISNLQHTGFSNPIENVSLKMFNGREEAEYPVSAADKGIFAYVVQGAFEVQHRLIETGDGVALWGTDNIEIEALSNKAVILVLELDIN